MCRINYCHSFFVIHVLGGIMRRLVSVLLCMFAVVVVPLTLSTRAWATDVAPIINVKYVHDAIRTKWGLDIPYNAGLTNPAAAANMRYVLGMVDRANARFNIETHYGTGPYATSAAANRTTANRAIEKLVDKPSGYPFIATTTPDTPEFNFDLSASGTFYVDWGDGTVDTIEKNDVNKQSFSHTYETAGTYVVKLGGRATGYSQDKEPEVHPTSLDDDAVAYGAPDEDYNYVPVISFAGNEYLAKIEGSLGKIFPTLPGGIQPRFSRTFVRCINLSGTIPGELFSGISGAPVAGMFYGTFSGSGSLTGAIPEKLFAGISGAPATGMFAETFLGCLGLTGKIPSELFAGISGAPAEFMFYGTFAGCGGLTGAIPEKLFAGISGAPAPYMFYGTFAGCGGLTAVPEKLFAGISGAPAVGMFAGTFFKCLGLTAIPEKLFAGISGAPAAGMFFNTFAGCEGLVTIPEKLFAGISGAPAESMFSMTFASCKGLTAIPKNLFGNISGAPADEMFNSTFSGCSGLTGEIPLGLFGNISGAPAYAMFSGTFSDCPGLTGPSARTPDGVPLYQAFPTATYDDVGGMYLNDENLSDYCEIPKSWGGGAGSYNCRNKN